MSVIHQGLASKVCVSYAQQTYEEEAGNHDLPTQRHLKSQYLWKADC